MSNEITRGYKEKLGWVPPYVDTLAKHRPDILEKYIEMRKAIVEKQVSDGLTLDFKEILFTTLLSIQGNTEGAVAHAKAAVRNGATVEQIVEALMIGVIAFGLPFMELSGVKAVQAAEQASNKST